MTIKKAYQDIVEFLQLNEESLVSEVLPHIVSLASAKQSSGGTRSSVSHRNEEGTVVAVQCFYFKLWMDPRVVAFGQKVSSTTGLNSMCKEGVSNWTKQQRVAK